MSTQAERSTSFPSLAEIAESWYFVEIGDTIQRGDIMLQTCTHKILNVHLDSIGMPCRSAVLWVIIRKRKISIRTTEYKRSKIVI